MKKDEINKCLKEQIGKSVENNKEVAESKLFLLDGIMAGDLPVYRKWIWESSINPDQLKWLFRIDVIQGRLQVDRIKFEEKGRMEFDTNNHSVILDTDFKTSTESEWRNGVHKLMKYIRNE